MRILLAEDHVIVREGLKQLLAPIAEGRFSEAVSGTQALDLAGAQRFDLIILDLNLPALGGLELLERLRQVSTAPILVFSMHAELLYISRALEAGAQGYLSKNASPEELLTAVRRVASGGRYIENELAQTLALEAVRPAPMFEQLSARDIEILRLLAAGRSLSDIAEALDLRYKTVANLCTQIKAKLGVARTTDLVRVALEVGVG